MNLYTHYKNKDYKFLFEAVHSDNLEKVVVYQALYDNELGELWVRPHDQFFGTIEVGNDTLPRFRKVSLHIEQKTELAENDDEMVRNLCIEIFGHWHADKYYSRKKDFKNFHFLTGSIDGQVVGFKLGYQLNDQTFYSWMGGVLATYRGLGIATDLMKAQHDWCRDQGYQFVQTKTQNRFREMLLTNIKNGFVIIDFVSSADDSKSKIFMKKNLK